MNNFLWGVYPYLCIVLFFLVPILRMAFRPFSWSTRASGLFGRRLLGAASLLFHWGLVLLLLGHLAGLFGGVLGLGIAITFFYWVGLVGGVAVLLGSLLALYRRVVSPEMRAISQAEDYIIHLFIIVLVCLALYQVLVLRIFGISYTAGSWAASLWTFSPQPDLMVSASLLTKLHVLLALTFFAYFPFTKLVHFWTFPVNYFVRPRISMRTVRYRFQRRWEFALRSDKSWLVYGLGTVVAIFLISSATLGLARPPAGSGVEPTTPQIKARAGALLTGYPLYVSQCARCHGLSGGGDGPGAHSPTFVALPRDFVYRGDHAGARYHFASTENGVATDADLYRSITEGLGDFSGMPAFPNLSEEQVLSLIEVLNGFRADGPRPGRLINGGTPPAATPQSLAHGGELFQEHCATCHGADGSGGGQITISWREDQVIIPANLRLGRIKHGAEPEEIFRRITVGIPGALGNKNLMTKFDELSVVERWALVHFVTEEVLP